MRNDMRLRAQRKTQHRNEVITENLVSKDKRISEKEAWKLIEHAGVMGCSHGTCSLFFTDRILQAASMIHLSFSALDMRCRKLPRIVFRGRK